MEELEKERERDELTVPCPIDDYKPGHNEVLREYEIRIKFLSRGCIVSVGCKDIAFEKIADAMTAVNNYVTEPYDSQNHWRKILE
jgi:hypothetical protein